MSNLIKQFAFSFGYFGAISLYCNITGQIAPHSQLFSITPETALTHATGYITGFLTSYNEMVTLYIDGAGLYSDGQLSKVDAYCIYGVWYTR